MKRILILLTILALFFISCSDNATIFKYDKNLQSIKCLKLSPFLADELIRTTLLKLYKFDSRCEYELSVSRKNSIVCNSNQNSDKKALSTFPSSFIRLDIYKSSQLIYSYYKDLTSKATKSDIEDGFLKLQSDMLE